MNWVRVITGILILWSTAAWGATLTWEANKELNLAGYRVYRCDGLPCTPQSGGSLLATLGKNETSLNIGTPAKIQYYFVTAYDSANRESGASSVVVVKPAPLTLPTSGSLRVDSPK
jgi:hypothetical protein